MRTRAIGVLIAILLTSGASGCDLSRGNAPPPPPGARQCIGMPLATCEEILASRRNERGAVALVAYRITCKVASCTAASGDADVALVWADGMVENSTYAWVVVR